MKAVWTFWTKPLLAKKSMAWLSEEYFFMSWVLSTETSRRYFDSIELQTDRLGEHLLKEILGLKFDHIIVNKDELNYIFPEWWAISKLHTYSLQEEPFIHIDNDVFLWKSLSDYLLKSEVFAQSPEQIKRDCNHSYYRIKDLENVIEANGGWLPDQWHSYSESSDILEAPCCGIFGGNNIDFINHYSAIAMQIVNHDQNQTVWSKWDKLIHGNVLIEQFLINACLDIYKCPVTNKSLKVKYLFKHGADPFSQNEAKVRGYTHLIATAKKNPAVMNDLERRVLNERPQYFSRCVEAAKYLRRHY